MIGKAHDIRRDGGNKLSAEKTLLIIVPAYNEEKCIGAVLEELKSQAVDFVVIDDGSTDATAAVCRGQGAKVISLPFNQGLSGAFQAGMRYAYKKGYAHAMQFDADGQHKAEYIQPMLAEMTRFEAIGQNGPDIVIGARDAFAKDNSSMRALGMTVIRKLIKLTTGERINDPTSGMRLYNRRMIDIYATQLNFGPEPDTLAYLMRCGVRIREFQVDMRDRQAGKSYLNAWNSAKYMARMALSILLIQFIRPRIALKEEC